MKFSQLSLLLLLALATLDVVSKCNAKRLGEEKEERPEKKGKLLAKANLKDDSVVEFREEIPGMIIIAATLKGEGKKEFKEKKNKKEKKEKDGRALGNDKDQKNKEERDDPVKLYKRLTGKTSKDLEQAWELVLLKAENDDPDKEEQPTAEDLEEIGGDVSDVENRRRQLVIDGQEWIDDYCTVDGPWVDVPEFCRCDNYRTTSTQNEVYGFQTTANEIDAYLYPYRGGLQQNVYYWGCDESCSTSCFAGWWPCTTSCFTACYWKVLVKDYAFNNELSWVGSYNARDYKWKFNVELAKNDGWHYSIIANSKDDSVEYNYGPDGYTCPNVY